ncbi:MAG: hypothetical protein IRZ15_06055 [Bryobacteraceae bacterium]|nr:hypothetical protein [Bryobacteraceae bacterium]
MKPALPALTPSESELLEGCVYAGQDGLRIVSIEKLPLPARLQVEHLRDQRYLERDGEAWVLRYNRFDQLWQERFNLPEFLAPWSPYTLHVDHCPDGWRVWFTFGHQEVQLRRIGYYLFRTGRSGAWLLDPLTYSLLERLERPAQANFFAEYAIRRTLAVESGACLGPNLARDNVLCPAETSSLPEGFPRLFPFHGELLLRSGTVWTRIVLDDRQRRLLAGWTPSSPHLPEIGPGAGISPPPRFTLRWTMINNQPAEVPAVFRRSKSPEPAAAPGGGRILDAPQVFGWPSRHYDCLAALLLECAGYRTCLLPPGALGCPHVLAARDEEVLLTVLPGNASTALDEAVRLRSYYWNRLGRCPRVALTLRQRTVPTELLDRSRLLGMDVAGATDLAVALESNGVTTEDAEVMASRRCRTIGEALEELME